VDGAGAVKLWSELEVLGVLRERRRGGRWIYTSYRVVPLLNTGRNLAPYLVSGW
jgi:hypothetical protein